MYKYIVFLFSGFILFGCSTEDYFGLSSEKELFKFGIEGQTGQTRIVDQTVLLNISEELFLTGLESLSATEIKVSDYATVEPKVGEKQDFRSPVIYTVIAEDGSTREYKVKVTRNVGNTTQLYNSNFELWHEGVVGVFNYTEIGFDTEDQTWGTGNQGAQFAIGLGADAKLPTIPFERDNQLAVEMTTQNMGALAAAFGGKGVAAGNLFAGVFELGTVTNAHPVFGIPFTQFPTAFKVDYQYKPGEGLINGKLEPVVGEDALDIFVILERREDDLVERMGVGWFRSGEEQEEWKTLEVAIKYATGSAPEGLEEYQTKILKYGADGNIDVTDPKDMSETKWGDITKEKPTHIVVVFTSSYQGDYFIGAPGSRLRIDNFELIY